MLAKVIPTGKDTMQASIDAFSDLSVSEGLQYDAHPNDEGYAQLGDDFHYGVMDAADKGWITNSRATA